MADLQNVEILQRLENLEQQNFRYRLVGVGFAVLVLAAVLMGQSKPNVASVVEAQSFVLRDKSGNLRGTLAVDTKTDASTLVLADQSGKIRAEFKVANDGNAGIAFGDANGKPRLIMGLKDAGSPDMGFADRQGNLRMGIGLDPDERPTIVMYDEKRNIVWSATGRKP
jgi:hypothetical protein